MALGLIATAGGCRQQITETEGLLQEPDTTEEFVLAGEVAETEPETEPFELEGDVAYIPDTEETETDAAESAEQAP